jgi:hypothetical protein
MHDFWKKNNLIACMMRILYYKILKNIYQLEKNTCALQRVNTILILLLLYGLARVKFTVGIDLDFFLRKS